MTRLGCYLLDKELPKHVRAESSYVTMEGVSVEIQKKLAKTAIAQLHVCRELLIIIILCTKAIALKFIITPEFLVQVLH